MTYAYTKRTGLPFAAAEQRLRSALAKQGFGIITEIDAQKTVKAKLGKDMPPYKILGACNPSFAHQAMSMEPDIGVLLPCNVLLRADGDVTVISAIRPTVQLGKAPALQPIAEEVERRLTAVVDETALPPVTR